MLGLKHLFNKEIKLINFKASKKQVRVPSMFLLYLASPFLRKVCVTQEIMGKNDKIYARFMQTLTA